MVVHPKGSLTSPDSLERVRKEQGSRGGQSWAVLTAQDLLSRGTHLSHVVPKTERNSLGEHQTAGARELLDVCSAGRRTLALRQKWPGLTAG